MKLTIHERITLSSILPVKSDFSTVRYLRTLLEALGLTEEEKKKFGYQELTDNEGNPTGAVKWNSEHAKTECGIDFGETMFNLTKETLKKLSDTKELHIGHVSLYEKFVDPGPPLEGVAVPKTE